MNASWTCVPSRTLFVQAHVSQQSLMLEAEDWRPVFVSLKKTEKEWESERDRRSLVEGIGKCIESSWKRSKKEIKEAEGMAHLLQLVIITVIPTCVDRETVYVYES